MPDEDIRRIFVLQVSLVLLAQLPRWSCCKPGSHKECDATPFVPGYNLAGEGFDITTNTRMGAYVVDVQSYMTSKDTCKLCKNHFQNNQFQKLPLSVLDWRPLTYCKKEVSSKLYHSVDSVVHSQSASNNYNWGGGVDISKWGKVGIQGSRSEVATFARSQDRADKMTYVTNKYSCRFYRYRLAPHAVPSAGFLRDIQTLPHKLSEDTKHSYLDIIQTYGTHYIHQVELGGSVEQITAFRTCLITLTHSSETEIKNALSMHFGLALGLEISANVNYGFALSNMRTRSENMGFYQELFSSHMEVRGGRGFHPNVHQQNMTKEFENWVGSLKIMPDVISHTLHPIYKMVKEPNIKNNFRKVIEEHVKEYQLAEGRSHAETCSHSPNVDHHCCPKKASYGRLKVSVIRATGLRADPITACDGYVKLWYGQTYHETRFIKDTNNPAWYTDIDFGFVDLYYDLVFEIWDKDVWRDDHLATCRVDVTEGYHSRTCHVNPGVFYFSYTLTCDTHLTGPKCHRYIPA